MKYAFGFEALLGAAPDACLLLSATGVIESINAAAERMLGWPPGALQGRPVQEVVTETPEEVQATLKQWSRSAQPTPARMTWRKAQGETILCRCNGSRVSPAQAGEPPLILVRAQPKAEASAHFVLLNRKIDDLNREIHARQEAEQELRALNAHLEAEVQRRTQALRQANEDLKRSNRELEEFAYVASHDLQEPLRKVQAFIDLLQRRLATTADEEAALYMERIAESARRMSRLIKALLDLSRFHTRQQPFQRVSLDDIARDVLADLESRVEETGGRVDVQPLPTIQADPLQMRQLFQNLIGNALKFHPPEVKPHVEVEGRISQADGHHTCVLTFRDNGIGIDPRYAERIFAPFQRLHTRSQFEGTGMGLAIVRRIAERHRGRVCIESRPGAGSTFIVELPVSLEAAPSGDGA